MKKGIVVSAVLMLLNQAGMPALYAQKDTTGSPSLAELSARADSISELAGEMGLVAEQGRVNLMEHMIRQAPEYQSFVKAINVADFVPLLSDTNRLTVFAPTNIAFSNLEGGNIEALTLAENLPELQRLVTTHLVAGYWPPDSLRAEIRRRGGEFSLPSVGEGGPLRFSMEGERLLLTDPIGNRLYPESPSACTNGWIYKIDTVLQPGPGE